MRIGAIVAAGFAVLLVLVVGLFGVIAVGKTFGRYQARADASNSVKVSQIEIRNQAQRVLIAKQQAQIRYQNSVGIRESQDEIAKTLTPLYVAFEMTEAMKAVAESGSNNTVIYIPTDPRTGLPIVPTSNKP